MTDLTPLEPQLEPQPEPVPEFPPDYPDCDPYDDRCGPPYRARCAEELREPPEDPDEYKIWAARILARRPRANLTDVKYRFPAATQRYVPDTNPYFASNPDYDDQHRITSLDALSKVLKFEEEAMFSKQHKHAVPTLTQAAVRCLSSLERHSTQWFESIKAGFNPGEGALCDILARDQGFKYCAYLRDGIERGCFNEILSEAEAEIAEAWPDYGHQFLPPVDLKDAVRWIRETRGFILQRCFNHLDQAMVNMRQSQGEIGPTHADNLVRQLALRVNPPPALPKPKPAKPTPAKSAA
jgi:hypothetical protein